MSQLSTVYGPLLPPDCSLCCAWAEPQRGCFCKGNARALAILLLPSCFLTASMPSLPFTAQKSFPQTPDLKLFLLYYWTCWQSHSCCSLPGECHLCAAILVLQKGSCGRRSWNTACSTSHAASCWLWDASTPSWAVIPLTGMTEEVPPGSHPPHCYLRVVSHPWYAQGCSRGTIGAHMDEESGNLMFSRCLLWKRRKREKNKEKA